MTWPLRGLVDLALVSLCCILIQEAFTRKRAEARRRESNLHSWLMQCASKAPTHVPRDNWEQSPKTIYMYEI